MRIFPGIYAFRSDNLRGVKVHPRLGRLGAGVSVIRGCRVTGFVLATDRLGVAIGSFFLSIWWQDLEELCSASA